MQVLRHMGWFQINTSLHQFSSNLVTNPIGTSISIGRVRFVCILRYWIEFNWIGFRDFVYSIQNNLFLLLPSKAGLLEHFKKAAYEGGWVAFQSVGNAELPCSVEYGRKRLTSGQIVRKWFNIKNDPLKLITTCSCPKTKCM